MEIGRGGFSVVNIIERIDINPTYDAQQGDLNESRARARLSSTCLNTETGLNRYVIKTLRNDLPQDEYTKGIVDLAVEARFLGMIQHPNIITMRAVANSDPLESRYFIILDLLTITLDVRMQEWRRDVGYAMGVWVPCVGHCCANREILQRLWLDRLFIARDIASALHHLHQESIVYRDLKPDNLGFDEEGELKLFDFGLAKRLHPDDRNADGTYNLTGNTGSLRYMAPEVAIGHPYTESVDTYSFGVLFWQICALATPYSGYTCKMHSDLVVGQGYRPKPDNSWPIPWTDLMRRCWSATIQERPDFGDIIETLDEEIEEMLGEDGHDGFPMTPRRLQQIHARKSQSIASRLKGVPADWKKLDLDTRINPTAAYRGGDIEVGMSAKLTSNKVI